MNIFEKVDRFFATLQDFDINYNTCFIVFVAAFLLTILCVIIVTAKSYESKLTKSIDMFNNYFLQTPNITDSNLVAFNNKMKSRKVPKQLRKQWQQFVLYREAKASEYMSYENCVTNQTGNSSFKRAIQIMNTLAYIFAAASLLLGLYVSYEIMDIASILQKSFLTPIIILLLNYIVSIFLNLRYNAVVTDLYQNYQYFEVNIDKATQTLPEYVDYEVLFDRAEIKRGIPMLYSYLQKRAEEEKRELEIARLKNVEHEKFNFDEAGVAGSLVLERAMQEAENYIAERKKYNQDTEQINSDITQEETNFREITKEYNRQMQVSKETFANFKAQLEEVSSSIEANYLKKQQQQELDRQRNLERDYDTATERHKKVMEGFQAELDGVDKYRAQSRKVLEDAMMSEFETYSSKVYDEAKKLVEEREKANYEKIKNKITELEEKIVSKNQELEKVYASNLALNQQLEAAGLESPVEPTQSSVDTVQQVEQPQPEPAQTEQNVVSEPVAEPEIPTEQYVPSSSYTEFIGQATEEPQPEFAQNTSENAEDTGFGGVNYDLSSFGNATDTDNVLGQQPTEPYNSETDNSSQEGGVSYDLSALEGLFGGTSSVPAEEPSEEEPKGGPEDGEDSGEDFDLSEFDKLFSSNNASEKEDETEEPKEGSDNSSSEGGVSYDLSAFDKLFGSFDNGESKLEEKNEEVKEENSSKYADEFDKLFANKNEEDEEDEEGEEDEDYSDEDLELDDPEYYNSTTQDESEESGVTKRRVGRPRKIVSDETKPEVKRGRGRPRKVVTEGTEPTVKKGRGRPRKEETQDIKPAAGKRGRPRKGISTVSSSTNSKRPGRPKKEETALNPKQSQGRGRPRKAVQAVQTAKKGRGRPRLDDKSSVKAKPKSNRGRPKKSSYTSYDVPASVSRGRPRKSGQSLNNLADIDAYLKEIDDVIAQENAKFEASKKGLEQSSRNIKKRK